MPKTQVMRLLGLVPADCERAVGNYFIDNLRDGRDCGDGPNKGQREYLVKFQGFGKMAWVPADQLPPDAADLARGYTLSNEEREEIKELGCAKPKQDQRGPKLHHTDGSLFLITDNRIFLAWMPLFVSESCTQVFYFLVNLFVLLNEEGCNWVFEHPMAYDAACQIKKFIINRKGLSPIAAKIAAWATKLLACDRMHYSNHVKAAHGAPLTWCEQHCNPDNIPEFDKMLTEKAEEAFQVRRMHVCCACGCQ
jgi:hypothetical protein